MKQRYEFSIHILHLLFFKPYVSSIEVIIFDSGVIKVNSLQERVYND